MSTQQGYVHRVLVAFDQFANVVFRGNPDETISSRASRAQKQGKVWGRVLIWFLDLIQPNHGIMAQESDIQRAETVEYIERTSLTKQ